MSNEWIKVTNTDFRLLVKSDVGTFVDLDFIHLYYIWKCAGYGEGIQQAIIRVDIPRGVDPAGDERPAIKYRIVLEEEK